MIGQPTALSNRVITITLTKGRFLTIVLSCRSLSGREFHRSDSANHLFNRLAPLADGEPQQGAVKVLASVVVLWVGAVEHNARKDADLQRPVIVAVECAHASRLDQRKKVVDESNRESQPSPVFVTRHPRNSFRDVWHLAKIAPGIRPARTALSGHHCSCICEQRVSLLTSSQCSRFELEVTQLLELYAKSRRSVSLCGSCTKWRDMATGKRVKQKPQGGEFTRAPNRHGSRSTPEVWMVRVRIASGSEKYRPHLDNTTTLLADGFGPF